MRSRILRKKQIQKYFKGFPKEKLAAFFIEVYHQSKPVYHLMANSDKNPITETGGGHEIGRVSKNIFGWFTWEKYDQPFMNVSRYQLKSLEKPENPNEKVGDNSILQYL